MARACIFCGGKPTTEEHIISKWLRPLLHQHESSTRITRHAQPDMSRPAELLSTYQRQKIEVTAKVVCKACNSGWMNDIEAAARPSIEKMVRGQVTLLGRDEQPNVAAWATLKPVLFQYRRQPRRPVDP